MPARRDTPSIYPVREDTLLLARFAAVPPGTRLLEIGCGNGWASEVAARAGARVVATDRNREALRALSRRARDAGLMIDCVRTDFAAGLGRFDRVLANPPYLPTGPGAADLDPGDRLALDGGPDGCRATAAIVADLADHLRPGGVAFLLVSSLQDRAGLDRILALWRGSGGGVAPVASRRMEGETLTVLRLDPPDTGRDRD
ncbi:MAG: methyltransferase [Thermoplasmata archaeon]